MVSKTVKVLHVSTVRVKEIIRESFHVLNVSARWVSQNASVTGWLHLKSCWVHTQVTKNRFVVV